MFQGSQIDPATIQAYQETDYRVDDNEPVTLRVGVASPVLAALHKAARVTSSAYVTACNPFGRVLHDTANAARQAVLARALKTRSLAFLEGLGAHPTNQWPAEPSFLVLGLSLEAAKALGAKHEQNAIVWCGPDAVPQLVLLR